MKDPYEAWHIRTEQAWLAEIERRITKLDSGTVQSIPWDQLSARLYGSTKSTSQA
jgi:putative addiction module component (TIGR02574 family)